MKPQQKKNIAIGFCIVLFMFSYVLSVYISSNNLDSRSKRESKNSRVKRTTGFVNDSNITDVNVTNDAYTTTTISSSNYSTTTSEKKDEFEHEEEDAHARYHHEQEHHPKHERFQVVTVNWPRVADPFIISLWIVFAGIAKIMFHYMNRIVSRVPESCLLICLGLVVGGIAYAVNRKHRIEELLFNPDTFFLFILPPIVMEAGYFMPKDPFLDNLGSILLYAIVGTIFNAMAIGCSLYGVYQANWMPGITDLTLLQCLLFGSIISAVDPVAVISVFEEIHVNTVLYICVFGESLLNDGVAVVLFHMFEGYIELDEIKPIDYVAAICSFFVVAMGGLLIGIIYGYIASFVTKFTHHNRIVEPTFVFILCYMAYLTAEIFHLSGIIAIVFAGFTMNSYVEHNISAKSHTTVKYGMKMMANVCETIIFMLLGIAAVSDFWQYWNTAFVLWTLMFITVFRAVGVVVLTAILNYFRLDKINRVDQFVMAYGGLRGAIAFSLVSLTSPTLVPSIKTMVCACIVCILFTSFVQGSTIRPIVEILHVKTASKHKITMIEDINLRLIEHLMTGVEDIIGHHGHHYWEQKWNRFNTDYLMKWFVREPYHSHDAEILETFNRINKREAACLVQEMGGGASFTMQSEKTLANLLLAGEIRRTSSHTSLGAMIKTNNMSDVCLDIRAIEAKQPPVNGTFTDAHHMLKENMYKPRTVQMNYKRGELPSDSVQKRQENEILMRRKIHNKKRKHHHHRKHRKHNTKTHMNDYCKHEKSEPTVSDVPEITLNTASTNYTNSNEDDDAGIMFIAGKDDENDNEIEQVEEPSCSKELPWKSNNQSLAAISDPHGKDADMDEPQTRLAATDYTVPDNTNVNNNVTKSPRKNDSTSNNSRTPKKSKSRGSLDSNKSPEHVPLLDVSSSDKILLVDIKDWETIEEEIV